MRKAPPVKAEMPPGEASRETSSWNTEATFSRAHRAAQDAAREFASKMPPLRCRHGHLTTRGIGAVRPSRRPLRGLLRMRIFPFLMPVPVYLILRRRESPSRRTLAHRQIHQAAPGLSSNSGEARDPLLRGRAADE